MPITAAENPARCVLRDEVLPASVLAGCRLDLPLHVRVAPRDLAIVRKDPSLRDCRSTALRLIELADSSLRKDRRAKLEIYAEAGVPQDWIINVQTMTAEVFTRLSGTSYLASRVLGDGAW